jgi:hypothetical protein
MMLDVMMIYLIHGLYDDLFSFFIGGYLMMKIFQLLILLQFDHKVKVYIYYSMNDKFHHHHHDHDRHQP